MCDDIHNSLLKFQLHDLMKLYRLIYRRKIDQQIIGGSLHSMHDTVYN